MNNDITHIIKNKFEEFTPSFKGKKFLLAVSGGIDSMSLLYLFKKMNLKCEVAHCNFNLRGIDSKKDEELVVNICNDLNIKLHIKHFQIQADENTQIQARKLRYEWFESFINTHVIVLGHHFDDQIETLFLNLVRGTGIKGLTGMEIFNGNYFRPFLELTKKEIEQWAHQNKVTYRLDQSNLDNIYSRNRIRNIVIPELEKIKPHLKKTLKENMQEFKLADEYIQKKMNEIPIDKKFGFDFIAEKYFPKDDYLKILLLRNYGFSRKDENTFAYINKAEPGKFFQSISHQLLRGKDGWFIRSLDEEIETFQKANIELNELNTIIKTQKWELSFILNPSKKISSHFFVNEDDFPLNVISPTTKSTIVLRGLKGSKNVKKLLSENGIPHWLQDNYPIISNNSGDIIIVPQIRVAHDYEKNESGIHMGLELTFM